MTSMILPMSSARVPSESMISPEELNGGVDAVEAFGGLFHGADAACTSSRERLEISSRTLAVSATRWMEVTIWSMEAEVSLTLEACVCVLFTMFCTLTLISCMVLVTSSMADEVCKLFWADSSEELATCVAALATCEAASRHIADQSAQAFDHPPESIGQCVIRGTGVHLDAEVAAGDGLGYGSHFLEVLDHRVEGAGELADLVLAVNVNVMVEFSGLPDLFRYQDQPIQRLGDFIGLAIGDDRAHDEGKEGTENGDDDGRGGGQLIIGVTLLEQVAIFAVDFVENVSGARNEGTGIFLQIKDLQLSDRRIAAIDGAAPVHQRIGEIGGPTLFEFLNFLEPVTLLLGVNELLGMMQVIGQQVLAIIHLLDIAGVAAEEIVLEVEAILHHLEAHGRDRFGHVDGALRRGFGLMLTPDGDHVDGEQNQHHRQDDSKAEIKLFSDAHRFNSASTVLLGYAPCYWFGSKRNSRVSVVSFEVVS